MLKEAETERDAEIKRAEEWAASADLSCGLELLEREAKKRFGSGDQRNRTSAEQAAVDVLECRRDAEARNP